MNYANQVYYPFAPQALNRLMTAGFLIWSVGPDGVYDLLDTVSLALPFTVTVTSPYNKDNVKSW